MKKMLFAVISGSLLYFASCKKDETTQPSGTLVKQSHASGVVEHTAWENNLEHTGWD